MSIYKSEKADGLGHPVNFEPQLRLLTQRMGALKRESAAGLSEELSQLTLAELSNAIEEMGVAQQEINRQHAELREAHGDLEYERYRYKSLFDSAPNAYLVTSLFGRIQQANHAALSILHSRQEFLQGSPLGRFVAIDHRAEFRERLSQFVANPPETPQTWETIIECRAGHCPFEAELTVASSSDHEREKLLWIIRDVTARNQLQRLVQQSERLAGLGQMVASFAHESGNSLQRSQAALELLGTCIADRPEALQLVAEIQRANDDLTYLQKCIRDYASPVRLAKCPTRLAQALHAAWDGLHLKLVGRQAELIECSDAADLQCEIDPLAIEQVFRNILENSLAACSDPTMIEVSWSDCELEGQPAVRIRLQDNGPGLSPAARERIFEPFFSTRAKGMGLGMSIVKRIVQAHAGQIQVDRAARRGTAIVIDLPRGQA